MGSGAVGGYFGARLAAAGNRVVFIARGAHLRAIGDDGLRVSSALGDLHLDPVRATGDPTRAGPADIVLFAVKLHDTEAAARALVPLVGRDTPVVTFQNGVESAAALSAILGREKVIGGTAQIAATIDEPGSIRHTGTMARLTFGELDGTSSPRVRALFEACEAAAIDATLSRRIEADVWRKFVFLSSFSGVTALTRLPIGPIREDAGTMALLDDAIDEAAAVGRAVGAEVPEGVEDKVRELIAGLPAGMKSSMQVDLERGRRLELPWLSGAVVRLGAAGGVATPTHARIATALEPHTEGGS